MAVLVSGCLYGCSTSPTAAPSAFDAGGDAGDLVDASHPFRQSGCPDALPTEGAACASTQTCEYGDDPHCRTLATCFGQPGNDFHWIYSRSAACAPNPAACPAAFTALANGAACPIDASCTYADGRCGCQRCIAGDAGSLGTEWECIAWRAPAGCPSVAPLMATACAVEGQECDYGEACSQVDVGHSIVCRDGYWTIAILGGACSGVSCK